VADRDPERTPPTPGNDSGELVVSPVADGGGVEVRLPDGGRVRLTRAAAATLRDGLAEALTGRREFRHTVGERRVDGSYEVSRRGASSAGHSKVFDSDETLGRLYRRLPDEFTADDLQEPGLTGSRRHVVLRHFCEHPGFDCRLVARQPLTARKTDGSGTGGGGD
jgi:hypothetical protein